MIPNGHSRYSCWFSAPFSAKKSTKLLQRLSRCLDASRPPHGCHVAMSTYAWEPGSIHVLPWLQWGKTLSTAWRMTGVRTGSKNRPCYMGAFTGKPSQLWVEQNGKTSNIWAFFFLIVALYINIISCKGLWRGLWRVCQALTVKIPKIEQFDIPVAGSVSNRASCPAKVPWEENSWRLDLLYNLQVDCKHLQSKLFRFFFWYSRPQTNTAMEHHLILIAEPTKRVGNLYQFSM